MDCANWVKKTTFDLELAIPQTLAYMAIHPNPEQPLYGMIANGSSYLFVKTLGKQYGISDLFATRSQYLNNFIWSFKNSQTFG